MTQFESSQSTPDDDNSAAESAVRDSTRKTQVEFILEENVDQTIFFSIDDLKKHEKEHKSEENDFMNEHEGKIYEEKNAKMFGCVM